MILLNMAADARPVRMAEKSSLATSTALSIFSSASRSVSSITVAPSSAAAARDADPEVVPSGRRCLRRRCSACGHERPDPLTSDGSCHVPLASIPNTIMGSRLSMHKLKAVASTTFKPWRSASVYVDLVELAGSRIGARVCRVHPVHGVLAHQHDVRADLQRAAGRRWCRWRSTGRRGRPRRSRHGPSPGAGWRAGARRARPPDPS